MKIAYSSFGDFSLKPYVHYLYAKRKYPNTPLFVYDDKFHKVTTKEEIENSDYIWLSFKDYGDTLPKNFDENDVFYIFGGASYYKPLLSFLKNCVVFKFKSSNTIQLDSPIYYENGKKLK